MRKFEERITAGPRCIVVGIQGGGSSTLLCYAQYVVLLSAFYEDYTLVRILIVDRGRRRAVG